MRLSSRLLFAAPIVFAWFAKSQSLQAEDESPAPTGYQKVCKEIAERISSASQVFYPGDARYTKDITNWSGVNTQNATCSVEPGTAEDVSSIIIILGKTRTPFGIKGGGHSLNYGFSSTSGVLLSMSRFSKVSYDRAHKTAVIGAGLVWDDVYAALEPHSVSVVGGRVTGVGVAGLTLGGGYSWHTNQRGLALDNVVAYDLVRPNGDIVQVDENSYPDLFFGLRGGFNNFGIVTKFTMKAFPQTKVWGGVIVYAEESIPKVKAAVTHFVDKVSDPKASIITALNAIPGQILVAQLLFYDAPTPPSGVFDAFMKIPSISADVSTRSLLSLVQSSPANLTFGQRSAFHTTPIQHYSATVIDAVVNETMFWGTKLTDKTGTVISYAIEPFLSDILSFNTIGSAYPPQRTYGLSPFDINYSWISAAYDDDFKSAGELSAKQLHKVVLADGQADARNGALYPNYSPADTPLEAMYGRNVPRLQEIKRAYDPDDVMGLAGGFKFV